jgi:coenzyme F420-dependent glucose-6-phosphate dehydrogenase
MYVYLFSPLSISNRKKNKRTEDTKSIYVYLKNSTIMAIIGYHASHEQFAPSQLLKYAQQAEQAGFECIHSSDHFHPWSTRQGQSGFSFSWIAAALQATSLPCSMVCAPGQRYHPAIAAQGIGTLAEMFPGRFHVELGSGEAVNEVITGEPWPDKGTRNDRLLECATVIRQLLQGETVNHRGLVNVTAATLYTRPLTPPPLFCAAITAQTAAWAGSWADGLLTTAEEPDATRRKIEAFRDIAGAPRPVYVQFAFSYNPSKKAALEEAWEQWRSNMLPPGKLADLCTPQEFEEATKHITMQDVAEKIKIFTDMKALMEHIEAYKAIGATAIILHNINKQQELFIEDFGKAR